VLVRALVAVLGDPTAFNGKGYMLLGLEIAGLAARYRDDSATRGGPLMVLVAPTLLGTHAGLWTTDE
jgi:hypothetical protein